ncbi:hypothetical protein D3Z45_16730 [Lachnospiraceae bacterium]|nr:hypothetical protein [Lachnospiraceae bacterium]
MAKGKKTKKRKWRLKRQVRKTLGCLFMISALIVTAIPVQPMEAAPGNATTGWVEDTVTDTDGKSRVDFKNNWVYSNTTTIPTIQGDAPIYQDETGNFRFAYVDSKGFHNSSEMNKMAVIVGFEAQELPGGKLVIPLTMDAYMRFTDTSSPSGSSYAAANKQGRPLFYQVMTEVTRSVPGNEQVRSVDDLNGDGLLNDWVTFDDVQRVQEPTEFSPCTPGTESKWSPGGLDVQLYYYNVGDGIPPASALKPDVDGKWDANWTPVTGSEDGRIVDAPVRYIGNQYAVFDEATKKWTIKDSTSRHSVFGGTDEGAAVANIVSITFERGSDGRSSVQGIGDFAFIGCTSLSSITLSNGLSALGNYAFANCRKLSSVTIPSEALLDTLGSGLFANCDKLESFTLPANIRRIGDFCFKNCVSLTEIITSEDPNGLGTNLDQIGYRAFENCTALQSLTLPASYHGADKKNNGVFHLSTVKGCTNLKYIKTFSRTIEFVTDAEPDTVVGGYAGSGEVDGDYTFENFKSEVGDDFYFEGHGYRAGTSGTKSPTHNMANVRHICFKYLNEDIYEIMEKGFSKDVPAGGSEDVGLIYQVNGANELIKFQIEDINSGITVQKPVPEIIMPEKVGPHEINSIMAGSFDNNCYVQKVVIPGSVVLIGDSAFQGSHNLQHIIFNNAANIETIGPNAFATQVVDTFHGNTSVHPNTCTDTGFLSASHTPFMSFTGAIEKDDGTNTEPFKYAMKETSKVNAGAQPTTYITYYSGMPTNLTVKYNPDTGKSELLHFPTMADLADGFHAPAGYEGAYTPRGSSTAYRYPYMTFELEQEAFGAASGGGGENQVNMRNGVENIVIPTGVQSVKEGLFSGLTVSGNTIASLPDVTFPDDTYQAPAKDIKSLTTKGLINIEPYTFARLPELLSAYVSGTASIGNYAFDECPKLETAEIGKETDTLGLRPFSGCDNLREVNFNGSPYFTEEEGIIYGLDENGAKVKIMQCLPGRGNVVGSRAVGPDELTGIKEIAPEAFMDCESIRQVDLTSSVVVNIPNRCFAESKNLNVVELPNTIKSIRAGSFWNTEGLASVKIPDSIAVIEPDAFALVEKNPDGTYGDPQKDRPASMRFDFITLPGSVADIYAEGYNYIGVKQDDSLKKVHEVTLIDGFNNTRYKTYQVVDGESLELTILDVNDHTAEGYQFTGWWPSAEIYNPIVAPTEITAMYEPIAANTYLVRFFDINKEEMKEYTQRVEEGKKAIAPPKDEMEVEGKVFKGWDRDYSAITGNVDIYSIYDDRADGMFYVTFYTDADLATMIGKTQEVKAGESAIEPAHPTKEGYTFVSWSSEGWKNVTRDWDIFAVYSQGSGNPNDPNDPNNPGGGNNNGGSGNGSGGSGSSGSSDDSVSGNGKKYKVTVNEGSGSGEYTAGTIVPINAYARADGTVFDKWTSSSNGVGFVNQSAVSTTFTMPANDVVISATFKKGGASSTVSGNTRSTRRNSTTTVDVTKNGISNTDLASANVNGSSDNFVIRVSDDAQATAAVIAALEAKYGDLSNIAYLPMDISLYDATGQRKITDVSGITVDITLPLPDGLIQYAGNNRAAAVSNGSLEDLNTKFTTIDGVPCVQFTATHFSPYTIYVDKGNLTEGLIDATPKTGDPIHPKWFLAMGLACISIILFCKKDKRQPRMKTA